MRVNLDTALRLLRLEYRQLMELTQKWTKGSHYSLYAVWKGGRGGPEHHRKIRNKKVRGAGSGTLFKPGDRRGIPRYYDPNNGDWTFLLNDLATYAVRRYALATPEDVQAWYHTSDVWQAALLLAAAQLNEDLVAQAQAAAQTEMAEA